MSDFIGPHQPPVRLCCMERHWGVVCPDGLVMCDVCFKRFPVASLATEDGHKIDVCEECFELHVKPKEQQPKT